MFRMLFAPIIRSTTAVYSHSIISRESPYICVCVCVCVSILFVSNIRFSLWLYLIWFSKYFKCEIQDFLIFIFVVYFTTSVFRTVTR
jgi:hypothetical protein